MNYPILHWNGYTKSKYIGNVSSKIKWLFANAKSEKWDAVFSTLTTSNSRLIENRWVFSVFELDSEESNSLLHYAAYSGADLDIVKELIELGALRNLRNKLNQKPIDIAKSRSQNHLFDILEPVNSYTFPINDLHQIEQNFHEIIMNRESGLINEVINEQSLLLPQLEPLLELEIPEGWFPIPGFMGGFNYWLRLKDNPIRLICESGSRMDQSGQEELREITTEGSKLLAEKDEGERFLLYLKLKKH